MSDDTTHSISLYQSQQKIYPRAVKGRFVSWRWALVWLTQIVFYGLPWLVWNNRQAVLFDLGARRFYIFGVVFYPQDFIYLTALLIISAYALFLFTAVAGRLWCGYACPQTVYTEIFMWIERKFEGDRAARMKLDAHPWSLDKLWRRGGTFGAWAALSLWTGFSFVGYFTPIRELAQELSTFSLSGWEAFWVLFYGAFTFLNAGYMREQVCKYMCPYARFQSAMFDRDTLIISYDAERGEPRGSRSKKADPKQLGLGSCVDCNLCVQVCPTGIDIRKGLQYECIGCAACVDVCDDVMRKMNYPRGLVRYDTENGLEQHLSRAQLVRRVFRPRVLIYGAILLAICVAVGYSIATRPPMRVDVIRDRSTLARQVDDGDIENIYRLQIMNATEQPQRYTITAEGLPGLRTSAPVSVDIGAIESHWVSVALRVPATTAAQTSPGSHDIRFIIEQTAPGAAPTPSKVYTLRESTTFMLPR